MMNKFVHFIKDFLFKKWFLYVVLLLWLIFQVCLVYFGAYSDLISDPGFYVYYATECVKNGTMYPDYSNYYDEYIFNPGYVNFLIVWIKLFGTVKFVPYFNVFLNIVIVYLIYVICKNLTEKRIAYLAIFLFILLPSYSTIVLHLYSEQLFVVFLLLAIVPFVKEYNKHIFFSLSGVSIAIAQWIRPLSLAWQLPCILFLLYKKEYKKLLVYISFYAITCFIIGAATHTNFPDYLYKAKTGGVNMIMGANDMADGKYNGAVRRDKNGLGYLDDVIDESRVTNVKYWVEDTVYVKRRNSRYTYSQYDSIYVHRSFEWIKNNSIKWLKISFMKVYWTFSKVPSFFYSYGGNLNVPYKMYSVIYKYSSYIYIGVIIASFMSLVINIRKQKFLFLIVFPLICYLFSIFLTCGASRYSLPCIPFLCISASMLVYNFSIIKFKFVSKPCSSNLSQNSSAHLNG